MGRKNVAKTVVSKKKKKIGREGNKDQKREKKGMVQDVFEKKEDTS